MIVPLHVTVSVVGIGSGVCVGICLARVDLLQQLLIGMLVAEAAVCCGFDKPVTCILKVMCVVCRCQCNGHGPCHPVTGACSCQNQTTTCDGCSVNIQVHSTCIYRVIII